MFVAEKYEFARAIRLGKEAGVTEVYAKDVEVHDDTHWLMFVCRDGRATRVPRENIIGIIGQWVKLDTTKTPEEMTVNPKKVKR